MRGVHTVASNPESSPGRARARTIGVACLFAVALAAAGAQASGPRYRADGWRADEFGRADGYPVGTAANREQKPYLVGAYSRGDTLLRHRRIAAPAQAAPLARAAEEPPIRYFAHGRTYTLDEYLAEHLTTGLLVARGDTILVERYQYDRRDTDRFTSQSMAKTIVGMLVGIAAAEGRIRSLDDPAEVYAPALAGSEFGRTPVKALLQMSSGIRFHHGFDDAGSIGDLRRLARGPPGADGLRAFDTRAAPPGTRFNYSSADTRVLGLVLAGATGTSVSEYAEAKLWQPLGAEAMATWQIDRAGGEVAACCFAATLRDWARLGLMLAHAGAWNGRQIVPREWIVAATTVAPADARLAPGRVNSRWGYGYQTWLLGDPAGTFVLRGLRGQAMLVDPATKTVMVHTAVQGYIEVAEYVELWRGVLKSLR